MDLGELIHHSIATIKVLAEQNNIVMLVDIDDNLPHLYADNRSIKQILFNLLSNAVKFSSMGGEISVKAHHVDGKIHMTISDQGTGIPEYPLENLTNPFYRV